MSNISQEIRGKNGGRTSLPLFLIGALICFFFLPEISLAAPTVTGVSGTLTHGSLVTITGTGFGVKNPAKPYLWAPFDGSANPSSLGIISTWSEIQNMQYNANEGYNGTGAIKGNSQSNPSAVWVAGINSSGFAWNDSGQSMYLFKRTRLNFAVLSGMNWKIFRSWRVGGTNSPNWYIATNNGNVTVEGLSASGDFEGGGYPYEANNNINKLRDTENKWQLHEILVKANTANNLADGLFYHYLNGELVGQFPYTTWATFLWKMRDGSASGSGAITQIYPIHGVLENYSISTAYRYWADDVYLDTTWARVMIGNAPTLAASTQREIQIPTVWAAGSVTVNVNRGAFNSGQTVYLYVVDADGNVNASGYPVTIGSGSTPPPTDTTAPSVPTTLTATTQSATSITLTWSPSTDNVGVTGYGLERCQGASCTTFTEVGTPTLTSYTDTGLTANTTYRYRVRARDAAGNNSGYSSITSATTQSTSATFTPCNTLTLSTFSESAYSAYAPPFDLFAQNAPHVSVECHTGDPTTVRVTVGKVGDTSRLTYGTGYYYNPATTSWTPYSGTCTGTTEGAWCRGHVTATITHQNINTTAQSPLFLVGYICSIQNNAWRCGCRDTTCLTSHWQLQAARR